MLRFKEAVLDSLIIHICFDPGRGGSKVHFFGCEIIEFDRDLKSRRTDGFGIYGYTGKLY